MPLDHDSTSNYASINPVDLKTATDALQSSVDGVNSQVVGLIEQFTSFGIDTSNLTTLTSTATTVSTLIPQLRRRQHMAEQLEAQSPQNGATVYFQGDLLGAFQTVKAAQAQANIDATTVTHARDHGENIPPSVYSDLTKYGTDPDFATAFVKDLGPDGTAYLLLHVEHVSSGTQPDQASMTAVGQTFATASYHVNFDANYIAQLDNSIGHLGVGVNPLKILTPIMRYGVWSQPSLENVADSAFSGPVYNNGVIGNLDNGTVDNIFRALANNPLAAADYYHKHQQAMYDLGNSKLPVQPTVSYVDFLHAATIDSRSSYYLWSLNDPKVKNLAEQNANFLINKVGQDGDQSHGLLDKTYADIGVEYFDDYVSTVGSPIDLSTFPNVNWMAVNASEDTWKKFFGAGVKSDQGLLELAAKFKSSLTDQAQTLNTSVQIADDTHKNPYGASANASSWQRYTHDQIQTDFTSIMQQLSKDDTESFNDRKNAVNGLVSMGLDWLQDPSSIPSDIVAQGESGIKSWLGSFITDKIVGDPPKRPSVKITRTSLDSGDNYATAAVQQWNQGLADKAKNPFGSYDDGQVTWHGDPSLYDPKHLFTNPDGTIKIDSTGQPDWDAISKNPEALHDFQQWLLDPAVQSHVSAVPGLPNK